MFKALRKRRRNDGGAVAVESAVVSLFLVTLVFGVLEFGLVISQSLAISSSVRAGARVAATAGTAADADYQVLQALRNAQGFMSLDDVNQVVIYKDTDVNRVVVDASCKKGIAVPGVCNVYSREDFNLTAQQLFESGKNSYWPASTRVQFVDYAGVYMGVEHHWLTNLFETNGRQLSDVTVMQIQPQAIKPWMPTTTTAAPTTTTTIPVTTTTAVAGATTTIKPTTTTTKAPVTTTTAKVTTTTTKSGCTPTYCPTTTTVKPTTTTVKPTTTTAKPTTTTAKPTTTTTKAPATTTTTKPPSIPSF